MFENSSNSCSVRDTNRAPSECSHMFYRWANLRDVLWINNDSVFSIRSKNRQKDSSHLINNHSWGFDITGRLVTAVGSALHPLTVLYTLCTTETDRYVARNIITPAPPSYSAAFSRWGSRFHYAYCIIYPKANNYVVCFVKWTSANYAANIVSAIYSTTLTHNVTLTSYAQWTIFFLCSMRLLVNDDWPIHSSCL